MKFNIKRNCIILLALAMQFSLTAFGEESVNNTAVICETASNELYDINANGLDIRQVLEALARLSKANIVISPEVKGEVSAHMQQLPIRDILDYLTNMSGFAWKLDGNTYLVATKAIINPPDPPKAAPEPIKPEIAVWECHYMNPTEAVILIEKLFPEVTAVVSPSSETPAIAPSGDVPGLGSTTATENTEDKTGKLLAIMGTPDQIKQVFDLLKCLDIARKQMVIEVAVTEIKSSGEKNTGVSWTWGDVNITEDDTTEGIQFGKFSREGMTFSGTISALISEGNANLLAKPNIAVVDGETADILIGDRILYPKLVGYNQVGGPIYDKEEERVGIYLQIAPKITDTNEILLSLYPRVSLVTGYLKTQAGDYPQISTREVKTTVNVKSGETLVIGGLIRDEEIRSMSKIPLLGDLPFFGELFRHTKKTTARTEIVIFITTRILDNK